MELAELAHYFLALLVVIIGMVIVLIPLWWSSSASFSFTWDASEAQVLMLRVTIHALLVGLSVTAHLVWMLQKELDRV